MADTWMLANNAQHLLRESKEISAGRTLEHINAVFPENGGVFILLVAQELMLVLGRHHTGIDERGDAEVQARQGRRVVLIAGEVADNGGEVGSGRDAAYDEAFLGVRFQG